MGECLRFLPAGEDAVLVELDDLASTLALLDGLLAARPGGVTELVPAARTLLVRFDPLVADLATLAEEISSANLSRRSETNGETFEIPVAYDGEDIADVAATLGCSVEELIRRHTATTYLVAFTGFAPGFAYLTCDDPSFDVPRRESPRVRVPAGSVALGGKFAGVYPSDSPGGWQLIGRTPLRMWDIHRPRPALLAPGDRVRFCALGKGATVLASATMEKAPAVTGPAAGLHVTRADRPALYQDLGRPGRADQGVGESGALDRASLIEANLCVGNPRGAAALEITLGGFALKADIPVTIAVTGAAAPLAIRTADGRSLWGPFGRPFKLERGDELTLDPPSAGVRSYLALRGGFLVESVLGSASTDTLANLGPAPIVEGDVLVPANAPSGDIDPRRPQSKKMPKVGETVTLDVLLGPRTDWFTDKAVATLFAQEWRVTADASRVGVRLAGAQPLEKCTPSELPSEATARGSIQIPHSGQPALFLADHPLTGGYPVIGVVARDHLDLAGQIPGGAKIRFNAVSDFAPIVRQSRGLRGSSAGQSG